MLLEVTYATEDYRCARIFNNKMALRYGDVDAVKGFSWDDIPNDFKEKNKRILDIKRGAGCYLWKPWTVSEALKQVNDGDYVIYIDAGIAVTGSLRHLVSALERSQQEIMCFYHAFVEKHWTKRDAFLLMGCDATEYTDTAQRAAHCIVVKKSIDSVGIINEWLQYSLDPRIITNQPNELGKENYEGFKEHRYDQSVWSLITKKRGLMPFRLPFEKQYKNCNNEFEMAVLARSDYDKMMEMYRSKSIKYEWQMNSKLWRFLEKKIFNQ